MAAHRHAAGWFSRSTGCDEVFQLATPGLLQPGSILSIQGKFLTVLFNPDVPIAGLDHDGNRRNQDTPLTGRPRV